VVVAILVATSSILFLMNRSVRAGRAQDTDVVRMRNVYVAISMYETVNDGLPPPDLAVLRRDMADDSQFVAVNDPFKVGTSFPIDPAFPNSTVRSPVRISFSYSPIWAESKKFDLGPWEQAQRNLRLGILASYWYGAIDSEHSDGRDTTGPVLRINMDGSVYRLNQRSDPHRLTPQDLFLLRSP